MKKLYSLLLIFVLSFSSSCKTSSSSSEEETPIDPIAYAETFVDDSYRLLFGPLYGSFGDYEAFVAKYYIEDEDTEYILALYETAIYYCLDVFVQVGWEAKNFALTEDWTIFGSDEILLKNVLSKYYDIQLITFDIKTYEKHYAESGYYPDATEYHGNTWGYVILGRYEEHGKIYPITSFMPEVEDYLEYCSGFLWWWDLTHQ